jgi:hypothetical protein
MKASATFKLSKQAKRSLALGQWKNADQRDSWRRQMVQAELAAAVPSRAPRQRDGNKEQNK